MSLNRLSGLFFILLGLALFFFVIPYDTEIVSYGWVRPQSVPNAMAWIMIIAGLIHFIHPTGTTDLHPRKAALALFYLLILIASVFLIARFGFEFVAPVFALALMLIIGERQPLWLGIGVIGIPLLIWFVVSVLLERPLP